MLTPNGIVLVSLLCLNVIIIVSFFTWCCVLLLNHWNQQYFIKRRHVLILLELISALGFNGMGITVVLATLVKRVEKDNIDLNLSDDTIAIIYDTSQIIFCIVSISFGLTIVLIRIWIFYYDMEISHIKKNQNWQMVIDADIINNNWFLNIKNQQKYYNAKFLAKIGFSVDLIAITLIIILWYSGWPVLATMVFILCPSLKFLWAIKIWRKYNCNNWKREDCFDVKKEITLSVCMLGSYCIILFILHFVVSYVYKRDSMPHALFSVVLIGFGSIGWCYLVVPYVINMQRKKYSNIITNRNKNSNSNKKENRMRWQEIVTTNDGYQQFINHLETEFSVENLLFLTEYIQVKNVLKNSYQSIWESMMNDKEKNRHIKFNVPLSNVSGENFKKNNGIPVSKIAKQLSDSINIEINSINNSENKKEENYNNENRNDGQDDRKDDGLQLQDKKKKENNCECGLFVIRSFSILYSKYIDENNAPFMINIASLTRNNLKCSLDAKYYLQSKRFGSQSTMVKSIDNLFARLKASTSSHNRHDFNIGLELAAVNNVSIDKSDKIKCFVCEEYFKIVSQQSDNSPMEWLLFQLISQMDSAAKEISLLINDSFLRFSHNQK